jgi:uncharacterized protein YegL
MRLPEAPGKEFALRELHYFWLLDGSTSMRGAKIESLNFSVANAIPEMRIAAERDPRAKVLEWLAMGERTEHTAKLTRDV